jgi:hypothetical protein
LYLKTTPVIPLSLIKNYALISKSYNSLNFNIASADVHPFSSSHLMALVYESAYKCPDNPDLVYDHEDGPSFA